MQKCKKTSFWDKSHPVERSYYKAMRWKLYRYIDEIRLMLAVNHQSNSGYNFGQEVSTYLWRVYIMEVYEIFPSCKSGAGFEDTVTNFLQSLGFNANRNGKDDGGIDIVAKKRIQ